MSLSIAPPLYLSDLSSYSCGQSDEDAYERDESTKKPRLDRLREAYAQTGTVPTVRAIILAMGHRHPHIFLLQRRSDNTYLLPGGRLNPGEDYETGLQRVLEKRLCIVSGGNYSVDQLVATWYRPQFTEQMLPYLPVHIRSPKEREEWYLVMLPDNARLQVPSKYELKCVRFYDLQDGEAKFGPQLSKVPVLVSRFNFELKS